MTSNQSNLLANSNNSYRSRPGSDFNSELSYDYSNNTYNPKISLRSYCFSQPQTSSSASSSYNSIAVSNFYGLGNSNSSVGSDFSSRNSHSSVSSNTSYPASNAVFSHKPSPPSFSDLLTAAPTSTGSGNPLALQSPNVKRDNVYTPPTFANSYPNTTVSTPNSDNLLSPGSDSDVSTFGSNTSTSTATNKKKKRCNLPKKTTKILIDWLNDNLNNPYPNSKEKFELIMKTGLTNQQLSNWFINARRRKINNLRENQVKQNHSMLN